MTVAKHFHQRWLKPSLLLARVSLWVLLPEADTEFLDTALMTKLSQKPTETALQGSVEQDPNICHTSSGQVPFPGPWTPPPPPGYFTSQQQGACPRPLQRPSSVYTIVGIKPSTDLSCSQLSRGSKQAQAKTIQSLLGSEELLEHCRPLGK